MKQIKWLGSSHRNQGAHTMSDKKSIEFSIEESTGNVFADLDLEQPAEYLAKAKLALQINNLIKYRRMTQQQAAELLGVDQPKISSLSRGKLSGFSLERLITFLNVLDQDVEILVKAKRNKRRSHGYLTVAFV